jgi:hypothetical protein
LFAVVSSSSAWSVRRASNAMNELIRRQLGNSFGDFFDFHVAQYSTAGASLSDGKESCGRTVVTKVSVQTSLSCRETGFCRQRQAEMLGFPSH